jgi:hypothetical protein
MTMAKKRPAPRKSARSKKSSKARIRDLDIRLGESVKGGFLGNLVKKAGTAVGPLIKSP